MISNDLETIFFIQFEKFARKMFINFLYGKTTPSMSFLSSKIGRNYKNWLL